MKQETVTHAVRIPKVLSDKLIRKADSEDRTVSNFLRRLIEKAVK